MADTPDDPWGEPDDVPFAKAIAFGCLIMAAVFVAACMLWLAVRHGWLS